MSVAIYECRNYAECRYAECCCDKCRGATKIYIINPDLESTDDNVFVFSFFSVQNRTKVAAVSRFGASQNFFFRVADGET